MKKFTLWISFVLLCSTGLVNAQSFESQVKTIKNRIDSITTSEKNLLKIEIKKIDEAFKKREIDQATAQQMKLDAAKKSSENINQKVEKEKEKLNLLLSQQVSQNIKTENPQNATDTIVIVRKKNSIKITASSHRKDTRKKVRYINSYSGLSLAIGLHALDGDIAKDFKVWGSKSIEIGYARNLTLVKDNSLTFHYGLSLMIDKLKFKNNDYFVNKNGVTSVEQYPLDLSKSKLKTTYLILPVTFNYNFPSRTTAEGFRMGVGAYAGTLLNEKQVLRYRNENGSKMREAVKNNLDATQWIYGVSAHFGYGTWIFYAKYTLTPLFENAPSKSYPFSIGVRIGY
ncbi:hypothetical protein EDL99_10065 [Ornithobacterium rhinotracheale]|uniref:outer membrane beta-barrel protein n=1 Tax=Ornithobacterium rhinotracheale TaxID=28251 RepID=UPI00129CE074|nr:outer membrane beta-barrel protein [Ornithobacterium rhinotracheale]MRJ09201.1 hypothetical protein [Ornithobacterium rhinotracheale]UOH76994.1 PorT family protein [Ornithobacterium rhinotracheale]